MKPKIIYIAGGGHSGSTLLSMIIGTSKEVFGLGEAYFYNSYHDEGSDPKLYKLESKTCTCGKQFSDCEFWSDVDKKLTEPLNILRNSSIIDTLKIGWNILVSPVSRLQFNLNLGDDIQLFDAVRSVHEDKGIDHKYFLDSSKDPRRLFRLVKLFGHERIIVIHLIRDMRGYVNSYNNKNKPRVTESGLDPQNFFKLGLQWTLLNYLTRMFLRRNKIEFIHISYDLFTKNPELYLRQLNDKLSISIPDDHLEKINTGTYHDIHGNMMKFRKIRSIKHDRSWSQELSVIKRFILNIFFSPFNSRYVFRDDISQ